MMTQVRKFLAPDLVYQIVSAPEARSTAPINVSCPSVTA
jgi:hypothetical protein